MYEFQKLFTTWPVCRSGWDPASAVNVMVTILVLVTGIVALVSGLRRKYPYGCSFLGHSRFGNYFMIAMFPIQSQYLAWSWDRLIAMLAFAVPIWFLAHFGLMPFRK